jgi:hypothetical protein
MSRLGPNSQASAWGVYHDASRWRDAVGARQTKPAPGESDGSSARRVLFRKALRSAHRAVLTA